MTVAGSRVRVGGDLYHPVVPAGAVYVGRQAFGLRRSPWANPYSVRKHGRDQALELYRRWLAERPELIDRARRELVGQTLACWCRPDEDCHADILLELIAGEAPAQGNERKKTSGDSGIRTREGR